MEKKHYGGLEEDELEKNDFEEEQPEEDYFKEEPSESPGDTLDPEVPEEEEEKLNDVNEILEEKSKKTKKEEKTKTSKAEKEKSGEEDFGWGEEGKKEEEKKEEEKSFWQGAAFWQIISAVLLLLLVTAVYTKGFDFTGAAILTQIEAEDKVLDYVNENLLKPPFTATVKASEELGGLFKVTLAVAGQEVDSYITKDGKFFFPQGFDLEAPEELGLEAPSAAPSTKVEVSVDDDPVKGEAGAPVTLVEFSDFQCPFCERGWEIMKQVEEEYVKTGKVKIVFRDFPLEFHDKAKAAAMAAECADEQGKFWEYHDKLFENQGELSMENFKKWAGELGLDGSQFNECLDSEKYKAEVEKDMGEGQEYGVSGTPAFFVNGRMITGAQPYEVFKEAIEEALKERGGETTEKQLEEVAEEVEAQAVPEEQEPAVKELTITAKKWRFDPKRLEVNQGDKVKLTISGEMDLNFVLADFGLEEEVLTGQTKTLEFTADKKGTFEFNCGTYCYKKYGDLQGGAMKGELTVS